MARTILGAAAAVALLYSPVVYEEKAIHISGFWRLSEKPPNLATSSGRVRVLGTVVYEEGSKLPEEIGRGILWWHQRVLASLLLAGWLAGALVGWREQRRSRRRPWPAERERRLWLVASLIVFAILTVAGFPGDGRVTLWFWLESEWSLAIRFGPRLPEKERFEYEFGAFARVTIAAIVIGWAAWAAHVAARARGVRWPKARRPDQASDYADDAVVPTKVDPTPSGSKT
ncbi:MAG TPA: hypothetical protein VKD71_00280 [Gemmataceae bacterium]|nr:hypothetical protein [Gemmataceae bacterium]